MSKNPLIKIYVLTIADGNFIGTQKIFDHEPTTEQVEQFYNDYLNIVDNSYVDAVIVHSFYVPEARYKDLLESNEPIYPRW